MTKLLGCSRLSDEAIGGDRLSAKSAIFALKARLFQRALDQLPKQGARKPWKLYQNYAKDLLSLRYGNVEDGVLRLSNPPAGVEAKKEMEAA